MNVEVLCIEIGSPGGAGYAGLARGLSQNSNCSCQPLSCPAEVSLSNSLNPHTPTPPPPPSVHCLSLEMKKKYTGLCCMFRSKLCFAFSHICLKPEKHPHRHRVSSGVWRARRACTVSRVQGTEQVAALCLRNVNRNGNLNLIF